ncbi:transposase [Gemmata massiliana]|uniref:transposase n=1 Tax=Gemmata massiliana TaxID=1210884 RepID=UPI0036F2681E
MNAEEHGPKLWPRACGQNRGPARPPPTGWRNTTCGGSAQRCGLDRVKGAPGPKSKAGNRRFVDRVLWIARTGSPWRDQPDRFGNGNSVWRRFRRWAEAGVWGTVLELVRDPDASTLVLDSTVVRAHLAAAGAGEKSWSGKRIGMPLRWFRKALGRPRRMSREDAQDRRADDRPRPGAGADRAAGRCGPSASRAGRSTRWPASPASTGPSAGAATRLAPGTRSRTDPGPRVPSRCPGTRSGSA